MVLAFSLVVLGLVGWRGDWVLWCMEGAMGVPGLAGAPGVDYSGITMASFAGAGGLICLVGS